MKIVRSRLESRRSLRMVTALACALQLSSAALAQSGTASPPTPPTAPKMPDAPKAPAPPKVPDAPTAAPSSAPALQKPGAAATAAASQIEIKKVDGAPTPEAIWKKFADSAGGRDAFKGPGSRLTKGRLLIPAVGLEGTVETRQRSPKLLLIRTNINGIGETVQGFDGENAWAVDSMVGPRLLEGDAVASVMRSADFEGPTGYLELAKESSTLGEANFRGHDTWVVKLTGLFDGDSTFFFDKDGGLLRGMKMTTDGGMGPVPVEVEMLEYAQFGPIKTATKSKMRVMMQEITMTVDDVSTNEIPVTEFEPPAEIKALIKAKKEAATTTAPSAPSTTTTAPPSKTVAPPSKPAAPPSKSTAPPSKNDAPPPAAP